MPRRGVTPRLRLRAWLRGVLLPRRGCARHPVHPGVQRRSARREPATDRRGSDSRVAQLPSGHQFELATREVVDDVPVHGRDSAQGSDTNGPPLVLGRLSHPAQPVLPRTPSYRDVDLVGVGAERVVAHAPQPVRLHRVIECPQPSHHRRTVQLPGSSRGAPSGAGRRSVARPSDGAGTDRAPRAARHDTRGAAPSGARRHGTNRTGRSRPSHTPPRVPGSSGASDTYGLACDMLRLIHVGSGSAMLPPWLRDGSGRRGDAGSAWSVVPMIAFPAVSANLANAFSPTLLGAEPVWPSPQLTHPVAGARRPGSTRRPLAIPLLRLTAVAARYYVFGQATASGPSRGSSRRWAARRRRPRMSASSTDPYAVILPARRAVRVAARGADRMPPKLYYVTTIAGLVARLLLSGSSPRAFSGVILDVTDSIATNQMSLTGVSFLDRRRLRSGASGRVAARSSRSTRSPRSSARLSDPARFDSAQLPLNFRTSTGRQRPAEAARESARALSATRTEFCGERSVYPTSRVMWARSPRLTSFTAFLRLASSIISSPSVTAPLRSPSVRGLLVGVEDVRTPCRTAPGWVRQLVED